MNEQHLARLDPYLAGNLAARGWEPWMEESAEQEADRAGLSGDRRAEFLRGWQDEVANAEQERKERQVKEYDEMAKGYEKGDPAAR